MIFCILSLFLNDLVANRVHFKLFFIWLWIIMIFDISKIRNEPTRKTHHHLIVRIFYRKLSRQRLEVIIEARIRLLNSILLHLLLYPLSLKCIATLNKVEVRNKSRAQVKINTWEHLFNILLSCLIYITKDYCAFKRAYVSNAFT